MTASLLLALPRSLLGVFFVVALAWVAYLLARAWLAGASVSTRWMACIAIILALGQLLLNVLDAFRVVGRPMFRLWAAFPVVLVSAVLAHRRLSGREARADLRSDLDVAFVAVREVFSPWLHRLLVVWCLLAATVRAVAGIVSPPLSWDTLTYHAFKPAQWVQYGFKARTLAPDQWGYYTYFQDAGEVPWAWSMLFMHSDAALAPIGVALWAACGFAAYALARALTATRANAFRAALLVAFLPGLLCQMVSGYTDMFVLLAFLAMGLALVLVFRRGGRGEMLLLGLSAGLLAGAKLSGVPLTVVGLGLAVLARGAGTRSVSRVGALLLAAVPLLLLAGPHYLGVWIERGNPFFPFTLKIAGWEISAGHPQLRALFAGEIVSGLPQLTTATALLLVMVVPAQPAPYEEFAGHGPALLLLVPMAALALVAGLRDHGKREWLLPAVALTTLAALPVIALMSDAYAGQRALWLPNLGRLLLPLPATLAVLATRLRGRAATVCWYVALLVTVPLAWPAGVANATLDAIAEVSPWLAASLTVAALVFVAFTRHPWLKGRREWMLPAVLGAAVLCAVLPLVRTRQASRYPIYKAAASREPAFIMHACLPIYTAGWPLWWALDDGRPHRIDASFGWDGVGHNGFRYPLLGSELQNLVFYVPITKGNGAIIDYQHSAKLRPEADEQAWLARLRDANVDRVYFGYPPPPEAEFVARHPEHFELIGRGQGGLHTLYRFIP